MAIAALVIAIVALLVAAFSAWYTRQQAHASGRQAAAAERQTALEVDRVHNERTPNIHLEIDGYGAVRGQRSAGPVTLNARNASSLTLDSVRVELTDQRSSSPRAVEGFEPSGESSFELGKMGVGEVMSVNLRCNFDTLGYAVPFRVTCRAGEEEWTLSRTVTVQI